MKNNCRKIQKEVLVIKRRSSPTFISRKQNRLQKQAIRVRLARPQRQQRALIPAANP